jgi:thiamine biosynthesis protein ThiS
MTLVPITLNGDPAEVEEGISLAELLASLEVESARVVVEHNSAILRGPALDTARLQAGDEVEVVQFVGGG